MNEMDREHYIDKSGFGTDSKQKVRSIIVKFKSWESQTVFYKARPRNVMNGSKKPDTESFSVSLDLTKRRYALLTKAKVSLKIIPQLHTPFVIYCFCIYIIVLWQ